MATAAKTPGTGPNPVVVVVLTDPTTKTIKVIPDEFWVTKGDQEVMWVCKQNHTHQGDCFHAHFDGGAPFKRVEFHKDMEFSGDQDGNAVPNKLYKYTVEIPGYKPLDPLGGVRQ